MHFITDFADQAVILPVFLAVAVILAATRRWRAAAAWLLAVPGVLGTILAMKVVCYACGFLVPAFAEDRLNVRSPSGHVASAAVVYAGIALLLAGVRTGPSPVGRMAAAFVVSAGVALLVGVTRTSLGAHSVSEVLIAAAVGSVGAVLFAGLARPLEGRARWLVMSALVVVWVVFHGVHLPAEAAIRNVLGEALRQTIMGCQPDSRQAGLPGMPSPTVPRTQAAAAPRTPWCRSG